MPKRILLADDSITIQKVVELTFSDGDYEVSAVNNGAKAIQKLTEMRPDIILSDIIMPEKNGYEVCEFVKSHPDYRNIPVVLLTGTFEPFDPDRAEKAGCDAVVTKPFESQSLIHKVEELIAQAKTTTAPAPAAPEPPAPEPASSPWMDEPQPPEPSPFTTSGGSFPLPPPESISHGADIFSAPPPPQATTEMPFDSPSADPFGAPPSAEQFSGETRAFPRMSFEEMQAMAAPAAAAPPPPVAPAPPPAPEPSPWDEPAATDSPFAAEPPAFAQEPTPPAFDTGSPFQAEPEFGETRSMTAVDFEEMNRMAPPAAAQPAPEPESPFGAPPAAEEFSGETRAFPRMSFEEMQKMVLPQEPAAEPAAQEPAAEPEPATSSLWDDEPAAAAPAFEAPAAAAAPEPSPWGEPEPAAFSGETRAFPKMSFEEMQQMASTPPAPEPEPAAWEAPEPAAPESSWAPAPEPEPEPAAFEVEPVESLFPATEPEPEEEPAPAAAAWDAETDRGTPLPVAAPPAPVAAPEAPAVSIAARAGDLSDDQIDRIARRVVELMSDKVVRNIAWEVIPDLAEMVVKERIRQLESEA